MSISLPVFIIFGVFFFLFGACAGSFLNVCIWRLPREESLVFPNSHCPKCGHALKAYENIPVLAWMILKGRCRYCGGTISPRYFFVELFTALLFLLIWIRCFQEGYNLNILLTFLFLGAAMVAVACIDFQHYLIPDEITYSGLGFALFLALVHPAGLVQGQQIPSFVEPALLETKIYSWLTQGVLAEKSFLALRTTAVIHTLAGAALGGILLWVFLEGGKLLFGRVRGSAEKPVSLWGSASGFVLADTGEFTHWDEVLQRAGDRFSARIRNLHSLVYELDGKEREYVLRDKHDLELDVQRNTMYIGDKKIPLKDVQVLDAEVTDWSIPREVMGWGDVKLSAMVGALLGVDAVLFVLMIGALMGTVIGGGVYLISLGRNGGAVPFGTFIATAVLLWLLAGDELFRWYLEIIKFRHYGVN